MRLTTLTLVGLMTATMAQADSGTWSMIAESGGCDVSFINEAIDDGIFFVDRGEADCGPDIGRVTGYSLNEDGAVMVLYSTLEGVDLVGQLNRREDGVYTGTLRGARGALRLEHKSGPRGIPDPLSGQMTEDVMPADEDEAEADAPLASASPGECLTYTGGSTCVEQDDIGPPEGGQLSPLSRMNMRDQGTTNGSTVIGRAEAGSCLAVTFCAEDGDGRLWCGVQSDAGVGYILKQDASTVYARNSCP